MSTASIDSALRRGLGRIKTIASLYKVYRIGGVSGLPNAATSVIHPLNLVNPAFPARFTMGLPKSIIEQEEVYKMTYSGICDVRSLKIGDVLVETGPPLTDTPDGRAFILADVQPLLPAVFARTEVMGSITRPNAATQANEPLLGMGAYQGQSKFDEWVFTLQNGLYKVQASGVVATIPMGLQPSIRLGAAQEFKFPTSTKRGLHYGYIAALFGEALQPGDMVSDQNGNRFKVETVNYFSSGFQGYQFICQSVFT